MPQIKKTGAMKTLSLLLIIALSNLTAAYSQDKVHVVREVDEMTDLIYHKLDRSLICVNEEKGMTFYVDLQFYSGGKDICEVNNLIALVKGMGCLENVEISFLFDDGSKFTLTSFKVYNCNNNSGYHFTSKIVEMLTHKTINKIRVTNGSNGKSLTHTITGKDKNYFIEAFEALNNKNAPVATWGDK